MTISANPLARAVPRTVLWFRSDLRVHDNPLLAAAQQGDKEVLPVYCFDPRQFGSAQWGCAKTGALRARFMLESVADLRQSLRQLGSDLVVGVGKPEELLPRLLPGPGSSIVTSEQVTSEELAVDRALRAALQLQSSTTRLQTVWSGTLYERNDLPFRDDLSDMPDVFTPYRNKVESKSQVRPPLAPPKRGSLRLPDATALTEALSAGDSAASMGLDFLPTLEGLGFEKDAAEAAYKTHPLAAMAYAGGETAALARLKHYLWDGDHLGTYFETRNGMLGMRLHAPRPKPPIRTRCLTRAAAPPQLRRSSAAAPPQLRRSSARALCDPPLLAGADYSSKFAPWLAHGCLSPRLVAQQCAEYERQRVKNKSTYWLVFELIWRDFYRFYALKQGDAIFRQARPSRCSHIVEPDSGHV